MAPNASSGSLPHLQIVDKLTELPLVRSALGHANQRYAALKGSSRLVNATLDRAEQSLQLVVNTGVVPVLNKFEQPSKLIGFLDRSISVANSLVSLSLPQSTTLTTLPCKDSIWP